jgi:hypothetical protein
MSAPSREIGANNPPKLEHRSAPGEQTERTANEQRENREDKNAAARVVGEGVHGGQDARAHQKGAKQRKGEGDDRKKDGPHFEGVTLLHHRDRVDEGRAGEPRHEGSVLDRVPEPEPAPAERVIGPEGAGGDAERQEAPGDKREWPHEARPGCIDAPLDQRCGGEGIDNREADIAEIQQRRMDREARVLENGIEVASLEGRGRQTLERIRGQENEGEERHADEALNGERVRAQRAWERTAEQGDDRAEHRQNEDPQQHRTLVVSPDAGDLVDCRHCAVRILGDVENGKIRGQMRVD